MIQYSVPGRPPNTGDPDYANQVLQTNTSTSVHLPSCDAHQPQSSTAHRVSPGQEPVIHLPTEGELVETNISVTEVQNKANPVLKCSTLKDTYFYFSHGQDSIVFIDKKLPPPESLPAPHARFDCQYFTSLSTLASAPGPSWAADTPNHLGARIPLIHTDLNMEQWRKHLIGYEDVELCQFLEFGFPVGVCTDPPARLVPAVRNHGSAYSFFPWIDTFVSSGVSKKYVAGPYHVQPFHEIHVSPMMTAPKKPNERRPVFDATYGDYSLNNGTPTDLYMGQPISLVYPSIEDFRELVIKCGPGCYLWKRDLSSFFLQIPADPVDYPRLVFIWRAACYFFIGLMFGLRNSGYQGQRITTAIVWIHRRLGLEATQAQMYNSVNYSDDIGGCEASESRAEQSSIALSNLFSELGLKESASKYHPPSTCMPFLGVQFDTVKLEMSVPADKLEEVREEVRLWKKKKTVTKKGLQQLLGRLFWVSRCVRFSRPFMGRLLQQLREVQHLADHKKSPMSPGCSEDIAWWDRYLRRFNGVELIYKDQPLGLSLYQLLDTPALVNCGDAQMWGGGAYFGNEYWSRSFPVWLRSPDIAIHIKEFYVVLASCLLWGHLWTGSLVYIFCDNDSVVDSLVYEKPRDKVMLQLVREFSYLVCTRRFTPVFRKIGTKENFEADFISRCHDPAETQRFFKKRGLIPKTLVEVPDNFFTLGSNW